ncbi:MAG TPA: acyl-CoA dehydrogenase family protein [Candidatus Limnocylindrales bacterium]|nr:acyl-CoA dehydrogenase family protein [Candidatus Limnocylindrales bacterium]
MDFSISAEQHDLQSRVIRFAQSELGAEAELHDREGRLDVAGWRRCANFGVLGWPVPREFGGGGLDLFDTVLALEALGYGCRDNGLVFAVNNHLWACAVYLTRHGNDSLRARYLPELASGRMIGAHALTETGAGSDIGAMETVARRSGDHWVVNGVKSFISNGPIADIFIVFARTSDTTGSQRALSAFVVTRDMAGVAVTDSFDKSGLRSCPMGEITFADCQVPADHMLGVEGDGHHIFSSTAAWERGMMFASQVGVLRRLVETGMRQAKSREQFGRPIGAFQSLAHELADANLRLELARLLLYKVAWLHQRGRMALLESAMLKLYVSETVRDTALSLMQLHGARGYLTAWGIEREVRDALAGTIYAGTSQMQREAISQLLGLPSGLTPRTTKAVTA